jgi:hypothetical protein
MTESKRQRQRWKADAAQILAPGPEWSALDGVPAPEYIPPMWDGVHVGVRLVDSFRVLNNLPLGIVKNFASGYWPDYWHDWGDLLSQEQGPEDNRDVAPMRIRLTMNEITRMERVIGWPGRYVIDDDVRRVVQRVGLLRSHDFDLEHIAHRMRRAANQLRKLNQDGLDQIAAGLRRDKIAIF